MNRKKRIFKPSMTNGIFGIVAAFFGIIWTIFVWRMGLTVFIPTGILIIVISAGNAFYNLTGVSKINNHFSSYDIKDEIQEEKSWDEILHQAEGLNEPEAEVVYHSEHPMILCPYCNRKIVSDAVYCSYCGREIRK